MFRFRVFSRGWGWLAGVFFFGFPVATQLGINAVGGPFAYLQHSRIYYALAMVAAALSAWFLGRRLNQRDSPGAVSNYDVAHSFMRLRLEYWAGIYLIMAALTFIV
jgi:hypothetical protein